MLLNGKQIRNATVTASKINLQGFAPTDDFDIATKKFVEDEKLVVAPASAPYLRIVDNELVMTALAITRVHVDTTATNIAAFVAASYIEGDEYQEGDTIIMQAHTGGVRVYLHNGDTTGGVADFTEVQNPGQNLTDEYIRALVSNGNGLNYNVMTGQFSVDTNLIATRQFVSDQITANQLTDAQIRGLLSAGTNLSYDPLIGRLSMENPLSTIISYREGGNGKYYNVSGGAETGAQLPSNTGGIEGVFVSDSGILWSASYGGVWRYDPVTRQGKLFNTTGGVEPGNGPQIAHNTTLCLLVDGDTVYAGSLLGGVWVYNDITGISQLYTVTTTAGVNGSPMASNDIRSLYVDATGTIWMGTWAAGVYRFNPTTNTGTRYTTTILPQNGEAVPNNRVLGITGTEDASEIWFATIGGGWRLETATDTGKVFRTDNYNGLGVAPHTNVIESIGLHAGLIFFGTNNNGLWIYNINTQTGRVLNNSNPVDSGQNLVSSTVWWIYGNGDLVYIATATSGIYILNVTNFEGVRYINTAIQNTLSRNGVNLTTNNVWSVFFDARTRTLYAGTNNQGVYQLEFSPDFTNAPPETLITKLYVDRKIIEYSFSIAAPRTDNRNQNPLATTGNEAETGITLVAAPKGLVILVINGKIESIGNGTKTSHAYFSANGGTTAKTFAALAAGDGLYWNGTVAGYDLDTNDVIDLYYI